MKVNQLGYRKRLRKMPHYVKLDSISASFQE